MEAFAIEGYPVGYQMATAEGVYVFVFVCIGVSGSVHCISRLVLSSIRKVQHVELLIYILTDAVGPRARKQSRPLALSTQTRTLKN